VPQNIKEGIEGHPVNWYEDVFDLVFPNLDREAANKCKACEWARENKDKLKADKEQKDDDE
jgi:Lon-like ATP-dependent protease